MSHSEPLVETLGPPLGSAQAFGFTDNEAASGTGTTEANQVGYVHSQPQMTTQLERSCVFLGSFTKVCAKFSSRHI